MELILMVAAGIVLAPFVGVILYFLAGGVFLGVFGFIAKVYSLFHKEVV